MLHRIVAESVTAPLTLHVCLQPGWNVDPEEAAAFAVAQRAAAAADAQPNPGGNAEVPPREHAD